MLTRGKMISQAILSTLLFFGAARAGTKIWDGEYEDDNEDVRQARALNVIITQGPSMPSARSLTLTSVSMLERTARCMDAHLLRRVLGEPSRDVPMGTDDWLFILLPTD